MTVNLPRPLRFALVIILAYTTASIEAWDKWDSRLWEYEIVYREDVEAEYEALVERYERNPQSLTREEISKMSNLGDEVGKSSPNRRTYFIGAWLSQTIEVSWNLGRKVVPRMLFECDEEGDEEGRKWRVTIGEHIVYPKRQKKPEEELESGGWRDKGAANLFLYSDTGGYFGRHRRRLNWVVGENEPSTYRTVDIMISGETKTYGVDEIGVDGIGYGATENQYMLYRAIYEDAEMLFSDLLDAEPVDGGKVAVSVADAEGRLRPMRMDNASNALTAIKDACPSSSIFDWMF